MTLFKGVRPTDKLEKQSLSPVPIGRNATLAQHSTHCDGWTVTIIFPFHLLLYIFSSKFPNTNMYPFATVKFCTKPIHVAYALRRCSGDELERVGGGARRQQPGWHPLTLRTCLSRHTDSPTNACILSLPGLASDPVAVSTHILNPT